jgi:hypothetical protein
MFFSGRSPATVPMRTGRPSSTDTARAAAGMATPLGMKVTRRAGSFHTPVAKRSRLREATTTETRFQPSSTRRIQTRRGSCRAASSGPKPSSTCTCGTTRGRLAAAHSMAPQL